jgi:hypothetical protein
MIHPNGKTSVAIFSGMFKSVLGPISPDPGITNVAYIANVWVKLNGLDPYKFVKFLQFG